MSADTLSNQLKTRAEQELIGSLILDSQAFARVSGIVTAERIIQNRHRVTFEAIRALADRGAVINAVSVAGELERRGDLAAAGGNDYLCSLVETTASARNVESYAMIVAGVPIARWPKPIDLPALLANPPTPPRWIVGDWLPCGYATLLAAHGGSGKSSMALHQAVCIALGRQWFGLHCSLRPVLYLSCEDRADVLHWRLARICAYESIEPADLTGLHIVDLVGHDAILYRRDPQTGSGVTAEHAELGRLIERTGAEVLYVDGVSDAFGGNENDRGEVKAFVNSLVRLTGKNGAVVLIHHVNKASAAAGASAEGYSGSTAWHNAVRARWYLAAEIERGDDGANPTGDLILSLQKSNLGRADQSFRVRWDEDSSLFIAERAESREDAEFRDHVEQQGIIAALREVAGQGDYCPAATTGRRTAFHVLSVTEALPESLKSKSSTRRFWRQIEQLRRMNIVGEGVIRRADGHRTVTLELQDATANGIGQSANESKPNSRRFDEAEPSANRRMPTGVIGGARADPDGDEIPF